MVNTATEQPTTTILEENTFKIHYDETAKSWFGSKIESIDGKLTYKSRIRISNYCIPFSIFENVQVISDTKSGKTMTMKQINSINGEELTFKDGTKALTSSCISKKPALVNNSLYTCELVNYYNVSDTFSPYCTISEVDVSTNKVLHNKCYKSKNISGNTIVLEIDKIPVSFNINQLSFSHTYLFPKTRI